MNDDDLHCDGRDEQLCVSNVRTSQTRDLLPPTPGAGSGAPRSP